MNRILRNASWIGVPDEVEAEPQVFEIETGQQAHAEHSRVEVEGWLRVFDSQHDLLHHEPYCRRVLLLADAWQRVQLLQRGTTHRIDSLPSCGRNGVRSWPLTRPEDCNSMYTTKTGLILHEQLIRSTISTLRIHAKWSSTSTSSAPASPPSIAPKSRKWLGRCISW